MKWWIPIVAVLLVGCPPAEDAPVPDPPADDDDATDPPMQTEGAWSGPSNGVVLYGQLGDYPCEGVGDLDVDADGRATGSISCTYAHTGDVCVFEIADAHALNFYACSTCAVVGVVWAK